MAISCSLNKDLLRTNTCGYSLPEITDIYLANFSEVTSAPVQYDCASGVVVTGITLATGATFYHIEPAKNSVTFTDELVAEDNGNKYRTHTLTFNLSGKYDKDMVCPLDALSLGRAVGLEANAATLSGGGDSNGITVTLTGNVTESSVPLNEAAIAVVKG